MHESRRELLQKAWEEKKSFCNYTSLIQLKLWWELITLRGFAILILPPSRGGEGQNGKASFKKMKLSPEDQLLSPTFLSTLEPYYEAYCYQGAWSRDVTMMNIFAWTIPEKEGPCTPSTCQKLWEGVALIDLKRFKQRKAWRDSNAKEKFFVVSCKIMYYAIYV